MSAECWKLLLWVAAGPGGIGSEVGGGRTLGCLDWRRHRAFRVEQVVGIRTEAKFDEGARVRNGFRLPTVVSLISLNGALRFLVPDARRFALQIMFANQSLLDLEGALRVGLLLAALPTGLASFFPLARVEARLGSALGGGGFGAGF